MDATTPSASLFDLDLYYQPPPKPKRKRRKPSTHVQLILEFKEMHTETHRFVNGDEREIKVFDQAEMAEAMGVDVVDLDDMVRAGVISFFRRDEETGAHYFSEPAYLGNIERGNILKSKGYTIKIIKTRTKGDPLPWLVMHMNEVRSRYPNAKQARQDATTRALGIKDILSDWVLTTKTDEWCFVPPTDLWRGN